MYHIIYLSWANAPFTNTQLQKLLTRSRQRNTELAVTGILLYGNERFLQVLEGEEEAVKAVYAHIRQDARHGNFITFANKPVAKRTFQDWAMAFQLATSQQLDDVIGYLGPPSAPVPAAGLSYYDSRLFDLLHSFVQP